MIRAAFWAVMCPCLVLFVMACSVRHTTIVKPAITFVGMTLAKGVQEQGDLGVAQLPSHAFLPTDKEAVALVTFNNMHGIVRLRWDWFGPDGKIYSSKEAKTFQTGKDKYYKKFSAWHTLTINGDQAARMAGEWHVKVYMNDELLDYKTFTIFEPR